MQNPAPLHHRGRRKSKSANAPRKHTMTTARGALFLRLKLIMATFGLSTGAKCRPLLGASSATNRSCSSFKFQSRMSTTSGRSKSSSHARCARRWLSSVAYGRTTFRHMKGDVDSWRIMCSPDNESSSSSSSSSSATSASIDLEPYRNKNNLDDQVFSAISADGGLKVTVATIRNLLN